MTNKLYRDGLNIPAAQVSLSEELPQNKDQCDFIQVFSSRQNESTDSGKHDSGPLVSGGNEAI